MNERDPDDFTAPGDDRLAVEAGRCPFFRDQLQQYIDLELDDSTLGLVAAHLRECSSCRREKDTLELERRQLLELMVPSPELSDRFAERVLVISSLNKPIRRRLWSARFAIGVAAGLLLASVSVAIVAMVLKGTGTDEGQVVGGRGDRGRVDRELRGPLSESLRVVSPDPSNHSETADTLVDSAQPGNHGALPSMSSIAIMVTDFPAVLFEGMFEHFPTLEVPCTNDLNQDSSIDLVDLASFAVTTLGGSDLPPGLGRWDEDCAALAGCVHPHEI